MKNSRKGFTLIEAIVSIMLLGLISVSILIMSMYAVKFNKLNDIRLTALNLSANQVEYLKTLDYKDLGLDITNYNPKGVVKENLYLNKENTNPIIMDNVEYKLLSSVYWESNVSTNGEFVAESTKKIDVTVKATDPFSGKERTYSILGTSIAFEGEREPIKFVPLKVRVITGETYNEPAKNVTVNINNTSNVLVSQGRTDELGEIFFGSLANAKYRVVPSKWDKDFVMMSRPTGITGNSPNQDWMLFNNVEIKKLESGQDYHESILFVDYPGYIELSKYPEIVTNNSIVTLMPDFTPPEGETINLNLGRLLKDLKNFKFWRSWEYKYIIKHGKYNYYFIDNLTGNLWDRRFGCDTNSSTIKKLDLGFSIKDGRFKKVSNKKLELEVEFTSPIIGGDINKMVFSIYENNNSIGISNIVINEIIANEKYKISIDITNTITENEIIFNIDNPEDELFVNAYGMKLVKDRNNCVLKLY